MSPDNKSLLGQIEGKGKGLIALATLLLLLATACVGGGNTRVAVPLLKSASGNLDPNPVPTPTLAPETPMSIVSGLQKAIRMNPATALDDFNTNPLASEFGNQNGASSVLVSGEVANVYLSEYGLKNYLFLMSEEGGTVRDMLGQSIPDLASILISSSAIGFYGNLSIEHNNTLHDSTYTFTTEQVWDGQLGTVYHTTVNVNDIPFVSYSWKPAEGVYDQVGGTFQGLAYVDLPPSTQN